MTPRGTHGETAEPPVRVEGDARRSASRLPSIFLMSNSLETGGSERQFAALAHSLDRSRWNVELGCIQREGPFLEGLNDVSEFRLGGNLYGLQSIRTRLRLARHLKRDKIAVAYAFDFYTNLTLIPAARWARVPVVIGSQRQLGDLLTWKQERAQAAVLRWCDAVVCNSRAAAVRLARFGLRESQIAVIANGLPPEAFAETPSALTRPFGSLRVGMIARMNTRTKNHPSFLRMAARLRARHPELQFVLVGDGPLRTDFERQAKELGLQEDGLFLGDRTDITAVLASIDISVLPSASESLSNVILESMAAGVPVVATGVGGNSELIAEDRGILVPAGDEEALIAAVERLLTDEGMRRSLGQAAKAFARKNFTLERMTQQHEELYRKLLDRKSGRRWVPARVSGRTKVALVAPSLRYVGGQSVQARLLLDSWRNDPDVEIQFIPIDPAFPWFLRWAERVPLLRTMIREPIYLLQLWRGLRHAEIAHIFSASYWSFLLAPAPACYVARWRGGKTVVHYHSGEARDHLRRFPGTQSALRRADRLVVPSPHLVDVFREAGLRSQDIPNIIDLLQFQFRARQPLSAHLICTRGFHPYYCVDVVVHAFAEVQKVFQDARLDLVGGGPLEAEIRKLVRDLGVSGVEFKGVVAHDQIGHEYDQADIFINASRLDNMPVSVLEAFACGLPVVSSEPEGLRHVVEHERTGLLSPVGDARALAQNVIRLLQDPSLAESVVSNALREAKRYSWPVVRGQWLDLYRTIAAEEVQAAEEAPAMSGDEKSHN
jgi:glycosyltransferase involved in cell wall biosynthesis